MHQLKCGFTHGAYSQGAESVAGPLEMLTSRFCYASHLVSIGLYKGRKEEATIFFTSEYSKYQNCSPKNFLSEVKP